jgi:hypothetical protein
MKRFGFANLWRQRRASARALNDILGAVEPPSRFDLLDWPRGRGVHAA